MRLSETAMPSAVTLGHSASSPRSRALRSSMIVAAPISSSIDMPAALRSLIRSSACLAEAMSSAASAVRVAASIMHSSSSASSASSARLSMRRTSRRPLALSLKVDRLT